MGRTALAKWESFKSKSAQKQARDRSKRVDRSSCERNYRSRKSWWPRENLREESLVAHLRQPFERSRCDDSRTAGELAHHSAIGRPSIRTTIPKRPDTPRFRRHRSEPVPRRGAPRGLPRRAGLSRVRASGINSLRPLDKLGVPSIYSGSPYFAALDLRLVRRVRGL